jgi:two-component system chemotaxis response regulator CheY
MANPDYAGMTVLVVDDVDSVRLCLTAFLRTLGIRNIREARDGTAALQILKAEKVDLVISDLLMSPMNGLDLTRSLRQPEYVLNRNAPVLMVSGKSESDAVKHALQAGVTDFLAKPITPIDLAFRLQTLFGKSETVLNLA